MLNSPQVSILDESGRPVAKLIFLFCVLACPALACELALVLSIDVSNSVDRREYKYQKDGLAAALLDIDVMHVLTRDHVSLTVVQWSGPDEQVAALPWQRMESMEDVLLFAEQVQDMDRAFLYSKTAVGDALAFAATLFDQVPECSRRVIDVSGDGMSNSGIDVAQQSALAATQSIEINAVAIGTFNSQVAAYFREFVITPGGFVLTSRNFEDYPRAIRAKLLRELIKPSG